MSVNLIGFDRAALIAFFHDLGEPSFRADQLMKWLHLRGITQFDQMTDLSKALRATLAEEAVVQVPRIVNERLSSDGTRKWLLQLDDCNAVESVFIPDGERGTLCVSSQVGCTLTCSFCATGHQGFNRNMTADEIISQVWLARDSLQAAGYERGITNIVFMGMGEPLFNYDAVLPVLRLLLDDCSYGLSRRRVTVSTAGVVPTINKLRDDCPVSLAVSLHAPNDKLRDQLVPLNKKYPISVLLEACRSYAKLDRRSRVTFEYIMLDGINDSQKHARQLVKILSGVPSKVNLIPYNSVPGLRFRSSSQAVIDRFRDVLLNAGIMTITRKTRGDDVNAACGQLAGDFIDRTKRSQRLAGISNGSGSALEAVV